MDIDILVPTDGSEPATAAFEHALEITADADGTLHLLNVAHSNNLGAALAGRDVVETLEQEGTELLERARERAEEQGVDVVTEVRRGDPREEIVAAAESVDFVVMGAHGRHGLGEYVLGTTTDYVINVTETPVLSVRADEGVRRSYPYDEILVPTDGSEHATAAVELAAEIATCNDATLHLLYVIDELPEHPDPLPEAVIADLEANAQTIVDEAAAVATDAGADADAVVASVATGSVPHEVRRRIDEIGADCIVMGTRGHTVLDRHLLGSFTEQLLRSAPVPVLTVQRGGDE